ncbi:hypothetical protein TcWFU_005908 [Taenia crassiceps]|uniref:Uncharacterized protein n=1 Tax=Taenia crassiceps TaxID=6207 RepID=A0ABR4Q533_9CEST
MCKCADTESVFADSPANQSNWLVALVALGTTTSGDLEVGIDLSVANIRHTSEHILVLLNFSSTHHSLSCVHVRVWMDAVAQCEVPFASHTNTRKELRTSCATTRRTVPKDNNNTNNKYQESCLNCSL